jgi:hypothetical protein
MMDAVQIEQSGHRFRQEQAKYSEKTGANIDRYELLVNKNH